MLAELYGSEDLPAAVAPGAVFLVAYPEIPFPGLVVENSFEAVTACRQPEQLTKTDPRFLSLCEKAVGEMNDFLQDWFNGAVEKSDEQLRRFSSVLNPGFQSIAPTGKVSNPRLAVKELRSSYGLWRLPDEPSGTIRVDNFALRFKTGYAAVVSYDEWHESQGSRRGFKTTAVLQLRWGRETEVEWLHLHRTAFPASKAKR